MRVEVVENIPERGAGVAGDDAAVKLALQNFTSALQGDDSFFDSRPIGKWQVISGGDGRATCAGGFVLSLRGKEAGRNRGLHFQLIQKMVELLKNAGSPEILKARLCLSSETEQESGQAVFSVRMELESVGDSNEQAALRWGLGLAHLQQALLFTSRYLRQQSSQKKS
jgi:hypothetical protein